MKRNIHDTRVEGLVHYKKYIEHVDNFYASGEEERKMASIHGSEQSSKKRTFETQRRVKVREWESRREREDRERGKKVKEKLTRLRTNSECHSNSGSHQTE